MSNQQLPKIFVFSNVRGGGDGPCYAIAEDGKVLGQHWCSSEAYAQYDLGVVEGSRPDRHKEYASHYSAGYIMEFVANHQINQHTGLQEALKRNSERNVKECDTTEGK